MEQQTTHTRAGQACRAHVWPRRATRRVWVTVHGRALGVLGQRLTGRKKARLKVTPKVRREQACAKRGGVQAAAVHNSGRSVAPLRAHAGHTQGTP